MQDSILIQAARVNNLKNISLRIPLGQFIVITGLSGSGKSSLAFDTLYAEGQRRYVESLSAYARQFLGRMNKPDCDSIKGLPPAIAIEQKVTARNPRSTVGTSTEIYDYLRMLYARIGHTYSPISGTEVRKDSVESIIACSLQYSEGTKFTLLAPIHLHHQRPLLEQLSVYLKQGISRLDVDGEMLRISDIIDQNALQTQVEDAFTHGRLHLLIDRLAVKKDDKTYLSRLSDSIETAFYEGSGECLLRFYPSRSLHHFSTRFEADGITFQEPSDQMFSFNSPIGACPTCEGFGKVVGIDEKLVIPDTSLSIMDGAVMCWRGEKLSEWKQEFIRRNGAKDFPIFTPYYSLTAAQKDILWHGDKSEQALPEKEQVSIDAFFRMVKENQYKIQYRVLQARYSGKTTCPACRGSRLRPEAQHVRINGRSISDLVRLPISQLRTFFEQLSLSEHDQQIGKRLLSEITHRLRFLCDVGLSYLTLDRLSNSLSGGESQRINLAKSLGSSLVGSLYILDEPSIGLHSRDTDQLIGVLHQLRDLGNTVIVVEHDEDIMKAADYIIDIGPGAGRLGGEVVYAGPNIFTPRQPLPPEQRQQLLEQTQSHTVRYLLHASQIDIPQSRRKWTQSISVIGARENNLKDIDVHFPLNVMTAITGVSGSGKSTLVRSLLYNALRRHLGENGDAPGEMTRLDGALNALQHVEFINQNPIGKSSRSNPATYIKAYDDIRKLMAQQPLSQQLNFTPAHFSFNTDGGRCEECKGDGVVKVEMQFMADLTLQCESCHGQRFKKEVLEVRFQGKNINDILHLTVNQAIEFFNLHQCSKIAKRLQPLQDVGLGYIRLGQSSSTLSGGENQRVKLAYYLSQEHVSPTLFIFDEPTTGLHFHDIRKLLAAFRSLIERGHSVITIEHNLDVVKMADYVIDLGPEGGQKGGKIVATGTPEELVAQGKGYTAAYLKEKMKVEAPHSSTTD